MFFHACGEENLNEVTFCWRCGVKLGTNVFDESKNNDSAKGQSCDLLTKKIRKQLYYFNIIRVGLFVLFVSVLLVAIILPRMPTFPLVNPSNGETSITRQATNTNQITSPNSQNERNKKANLETASPLSEGLPGQNGQTTKEQLDEEIIAKQTNQLVSSDKYGSQYMSDYVQYIVSGLISGGVCDDLKQVIETMATSSNPDNIKILQIDKILETAERAGCIR